ncbi:hypothetical protein CHUAL_003205 [Chamberlinius hualienensis]
MYFQSKRSKLYPIRPKSLPPILSPILTTLPNMLIKNKRFDRLLEEFRCPTGPTLVSVDFEVFGDVQGVFFVKYCKEMSNTLRLRGWVRNSRQGTVVGKIQGVKELVDDMAMWLRLQGSPGSRIDHCSFRNWSIIDGYDFRDFRILY